MVSVNNAAGKVFKTWTPNKLLLHKNLSNDLKVPNLWSTWIIYSTTVKDKLLLQDLWKWRLTDEPVDEETHDMQHYIATDNHLSS